MTIKRNVCDDCVNHDLRGKRGPEADTFVDMEIEGIRGNTWGVMILPKIDDPGRGLDTARHRKGTV